MIPKDTIERIKEMTDIVEVIDDYVQLKKSGSSYKGLSPFVDEKTPSFMVSPSKGIFKDFSSGKGGDAISFLMELEGYSYVEALKFLAQKYGIEIQEKEETEEARAQRTEKDSLYIALNFAKDHYKQLLSEHDEGQSIAKSYFYERGFSDHTIDLFDLGYALNEWDGLIKEAENKQYNLDILDKAGLVIRKEDKTYDRFRGRVIFPIHNVTGKVIAFGARILTNEKNQPKYINSPETAVYHKSNVLYGIHQAKNEVRNQDNCYLVEGYTDVISLYQHGVKNVVASSGTALTKEQIKLIKRYTQNVTVLYDGDKAGIRASLRGIDMILEAGLNVHAVTFPEGEDPDSYVRKVGGESFKEHLETKRQDFITFKVNLFLEEAGNDPLKKAELINDIVESIAKIPDAVKRSVFFQQCSSLLNIDEQVLITQYNKSVVKARSEKRNDFPKPPPIGYEDTAGMPPLLEDEVSTAIPKINDFELQSVLEMEREIARILFHHGKVQTSEDHILLGEFIVEEVDDVEFKNEKIKKLIDFYREKLKNDKEVSMNELIDHEDEDIKSVAIDISTSRYEISENWKKFQIYVKSESDHIEHVVMQSIVRLKWRNVRLILRDLEKEMRETTPDDEKMTSIQEKYITYKNMEMTLAKLLGNVAVGRS